MPAPTSLDPGCESSVRVGVLHGVRHGDQPLLTEAWPSPWRKVMMNKPDLKLPDFELRGTQSAIQS
jgi:hypothetical protein